MASEKDSRKMIDLFALGYAFELSKTIDYFCKKHCFGCLHGYDAYIHHNLCQIASPMEKISYVYDCAMEEVCHEQAYLNFKLLLFVSDTVKDKFIPPRYSHYMYRQHIVKDDKFKDSVIRHTINVIDF